MVSVALLVGGGGEKEVADEKPAKEKKSVKAPIREVSAEELEKRDGVQYVKGENIPFTGTAIHYREDGSKLYDQEYMKGKMDGMLVVYREDGSKKYEVRRVHYKKVGTEVWFSEDGSVLKEVVYENGKKITETEY